MISLFSLIANLWFGSSGLGLFCTEIDVIGMTKLARAGELNTVSLHAEYLSAAENIVGEVCNYNKWEVLSF